MKKEKNKHPEKSQDETPIYLTSNSTLQTEEEHRLDQAIDPTKDVTREVSSDDLHEPHLGLLTGREPEEE